jgi:hypothetical protein
MQLKGVDVRIKGLSPLLMHRYPIEGVDALEKMSPKEQAEIAAYRHPKNKKLFVPSENLWAALVGGAVFVKGKGRASLQKVAAACLQVYPPYLLLPDKEYDVDSRAVRMPATRGTVIRHRPRIDEWELEFELIFDQSLLSESQARDVVDNAGARVGLLDFRPATKGPFGRFIVTRWDVQKSRK